MCQNVIGKQIFARIHHIYLSWMQKHNFVMSVYFEATFPIKGVVLFTLVRFEIDYHRYTLMCLR